MYDDSTTTTAINTATRKNATKDSRPSLDEIIHNRIDPLEQPWMTPTPISEVDVKDDAAWREHNRHIDRLSNAIVEGLGPGTYISEDIKNRLYAYHQVSNPEVQSSVL